MAVNEHDTAGTPRDERIAALYRQAALEEPPARLDAVIARDARRALEPQAARARPWWQIWRVPFAFAAVAVLSVSVVTIVSREGGEPLTIGERAPMSAAPSTAAPPTAPQQEPSPAPAQLPREAQPQAAQSERRKVEALQREERRRHSSARSERSTAPRSEPASSPPVSAADAAGKLGEIESRAFTDRSTAADTGARAPEAGRAPYALSAPAAAPAPPPRPVVVAPPAAAPAPAAPPDARLAKEAPAASAPSVAVQRRSAAAPAPKPATSAGNALSPAVAALVAELEGKAPATWLERIAALRRDGRTEDADALLAEFRRRHPDEPLSQGVK